MDIEAIAKTIHQRGLTVPAVFFLESSKPLCGLLSPTMTMSEPLLGALVGFQRYREQQDFWTKSENLEALILELERLGRNDRS